MKLIISGGTGFLATELIRQSLHMNEITSLIVLARKPISPPAGLDATKLKQVIISDYQTYPDDARKEFADAKACIWTVSITPTKSRMYDFEEVKRVCQTSTLDGLRAMHESNPARPFRFMYTSGFGVERYSEAPLGFAAYAKMRLETETQVVDFAKEQPAGEVEACVVRPGMITSNVSIWRSLWGGAMRLTNVGTHITVQELAASMLEQAVSGFTQQIWLNDECKVKGAAILEAASK